MKELSRSNFLLYPTRFPEVGCITVMKAMSVGTIPITSRYTDSVLRPRIYSRNVSGIRDGDAITESFDMGPVTAYDNKMDYMTWISNHWVPSVILAYENSIKVSNNSCSSMCKRCTPDSFCDFRNNMMQFARDSFSWKKSARDFESLLTGTGM
jgi:hypothetical protein